VLGATVGALTACDDLLEAEIPHLLTDDALAGAGTAGTQIASIQALYECGASSFGWIALGHEDVYESIAGVAGGAHIYRETPLTGTCDTSGPDGSWFDQIMGARALNSNADGNGLYDKIESGEFSLGATGTQIQAIGAIYHAAALLHFGQYFCEGAIDESAPMDPDDFLADATTWINNADSKIGGSDFAMPNNAASSADLMAQAIRAQILYAQGNLAGAAAAASSVPTDFTAWITRESGEQRRNGYAAKGGFSGMYGPNDWWLPASRVNPATGQDYADPIPFTGYIFLGFGPEGETLDANNLPVRWAEEDRAEGDPPTPLAGFDSGDADTRVVHEKQPIQGPEPREVVTKYTDDSDDIPMASGIEMRLIEVLNAANQGDEAGAIGFINELRQADGLTEIQGAYETALLNGTYTSTMREVVFEEARRALFASAGRFHAWKINNTDLSFFPRTQGTTPFQGYQLLGGVRYQFPNDEYELNPNFEALGRLDARGTLCAPDEAPFIL
jgi:hypothetical protein